MKTDKDRGNISFAVFNKNFGNIRNAGLRYSFEITPTGNAYKMFDSWSDGAAGMLVHLFRYVTGRLYKNDVKRTTIEKIINTWAPPFENATENYIDFVAKKTGIGRRDEIQFLPATMYLICKAMSQMEDNKAYPNFTAEMYAEAWKTAQAEILKRWAVKVPDLQNNITV